MARGWESKSVEEQISAAAISPRSAIPPTAHAPEVLESMRKREGLIMSRTHVVRELETAQNPRYRAQLTKALADLDAQLNTCKPLVRTSGVS
jgi:hypothetical protein